MPRLFTGLELPEAVVAQMALARGGLFGARWLEPDGLSHHPALRRRRRRDGPRATSPRRSAKSAARRLRCASTGLGWFGGDKPRAIVARVKPEPALIELQAEQERRLRRVGVAPETRKFTPHVTLARLRRVRPRAVADYLASRGALAVEAFTAARFVLYSAREGSGGGPYVVEAAYPLGSK